MAVRRKRRVFISFDYDNDRHYRYLLNALAANPNSAVELTDGTPGEIQSSDIARIKAVLTRRIREADVTLVIVGEYANSYHRDWMSIGYRNWQCWEVAKSYEEGNRLIAVKIKASYSAPETLYGKGATWINGFDTAAIARALG